MLGSPTEADDALQEAMLGAWRGMAGFEGRSSLRSWLYTVATNACLRRIAERPKRLLAYEYGPSAAPDAAIEAIVDGEVWVEPYPDEPALRYEALESVELAFVAALQHLPATQRAVLVLREVLGFSAVEVAEQLELTSAAVESALQRARVTVAQRVPPKSQQATLRDLGESAQRELVRRFTLAWEQADIEGLVRLLAQDVKFTMPPLPNWFDGQANVARFFAERVFTTPWRLRPLRASGQLAFACYQGPDFRLGALNVLTLRGQFIAELTGFLDPAIHFKFRLPER
jgi:RNA polymerase sigma-70 factor (TIGR02960 family)